MQPNYDLAQERRKQAGPRGSQSCLRHMGEWGKTMQDKRSGLDGPVKALAKSSPQARHHFTQADQVNQLVSASEADPDLGFMARMMALCSLPRTNPGNRKNTSASTGR